LVFKNGFAGKKYIILLNTPGPNDPYLFVKTTAQKKDKPSKPGCIENRSLFFIPAKTTFFESDTWIQLHEIYSITPDVVIKDSDITEEGSFDLKSIEKIVNCLFLSSEDDISPDHRRLLSPPLEESLKKLQAKFGKKP
jgi:hypothetical protein